MGRGLRVFMGSSLSTHKTKRKEGHESPNLFFFNSRPVCLTAWSGEAADERFEHSFCFFGGWLVFGGVVVVEVQPSGFLIIIYINYFYILIINQHGCAPFPPPPPSLPLSNE